METLSNNINDNKDLEFIPFDTKDNVFNREANWFPVIRLNTTAVDTITNQFITGFSNPVNECRIDNEIFNDVIYSDIEEYKPSENQPYKKANLEMQSEKRKNQNNSSKKSKGKSSDKNRKVENEGNFNEPKHMKILREGNFEFLEGYSRSEKVSLAEDIYRIIEVNNKEIFDIFSDYEVPKPIMDVVIKKIIKITLDNDNR